MRDIPGYEGLYAVTSCGRVWGHKSKKFLKQHNNGHGYYWAQITDGHRHYKRLYVHRCVAMAYIPNPNNLPEVNHKDRDRGNNCLNNLEWCDRQYNVNYSCKKVKCVETNKIYNTAVEAGKDINRCSTGILACNQAFACVIS